MDSIARHVAAMYVPSLQLTAALHDSNPALTAKLRGVVVKASSGEIDEKLFSYEDAMRYALSIRRRGESGLGSLGTLKTFTLIAQPTRSEPRYLATYERGEVEWRFFIDRNGLIAELEPTLR